MQEKDNHFFKEKYINTFQSKGYQNLPPRYISLIQSKGTSLKYFHLW